MSSAASEQRRRSSRGEIAGGTDIFVGASGSSAATVRARGLLGRAADGSCAFDAPTLRELDTLSSSGTFAY